MEDHYLLTEAFISCKQTLMKDQQISTSIIQENTQKKKASYKIKDLSTYNLGLIGNELHLISQDDESLEIYYPYRETVKLEANESVLLIDDGKVYINAWIEEGWDDDKNIASEDYSYYDKLIIKDMDSNIISERVGNLHQRPDGTWWLA